MDPTEDMCRSLIKWLQSIVPNKSRNTLEICDGVAMLEALKQIAPEHFNKLEPKIKKDISNSRHLRVSNLKKIVEAVIEYYQDVLTLQLLEAGRPDSLEIGNNMNTVELAKLLRLILGCAINCSRKQDYITKIMSMEESVQQNIMQAIQQLENVTGGRSGLSLLILDSDTKVVKLAAELEATNEVKENLMQQYQQLEVQYQNLLDEKQNLSVENQNYKDKEHKYIEMRKQNEILKEELYKFEVIRDDCKAKINAQHKQILANQEKISELQLAANDTSRLKDEVDALSESAMKVNDLELTLTSYKKKLENYTDMKKTLQKLEEKNMEYLQKNMELEEELSKYNTWKIQCENYKKQVAEMEQKIDEETQRADKAQFNLDKLENKLKTLQSEKERLAQERDILKDENDELKLGLTKIEHNCAAMSQELTPNEMKERLKFLEKENKNLRKITQEHDSTQALLDNAYNRIDKLQQQNRISNQTIIKLEAQIEELHKLQNDDLHDNIIIKDYKQKIIHLQEQLITKDNELQTTQAKYTRNLEKAREMVQQFDVKTNGGANNNNNNNINSTTGNNFVHHQMKDTEEKLLISAFYNLGMNCHREAIDERFVLSAGQGQSFLARQRQATPRKPVQRFKSK